MMRERTSPQATTRARKRRVPLGQWRYEDLEVYLYPASPKCDYHNHNMSATNVQFSVALLRCLLLRG